ncbi:MAG: adenosine deaminase [Leptospiraceae bacterium]|nr:adenosine deaminase [Leptospiraceae bacterium]
MGLTELHNHLYGSISVETLFWLGKNNPNPRWNLFTESYEKEFGKKIDPKNFFEVYDEPNKLGELYYFDKPGPFSQFQAKFNLIIALSTLNEEELIEVSRKTILEHWKEGISYIEYRQMFSPIATREDYVKKLNAICKGLKKGEEESGNKISGRLAISLHRDKLYIDQYEWVKQIQRDDSLVRKYLVGIDFCHIEENFPPKEKIKFFQKVHEDNQIEKETALSILYHVAESFEDKTPHSAIRWVLDAAGSKVHRLGHCIALGVNPEIYLGKKFHEKVSERRDQLKFLMDHYDEIRSFGVIVEKNQLEKEYQALGDRKDNELLEFIGDKNFLEELLIFQDYAISIIEKSDSIVETCPTSNLLIGRIPRLSDHPLKRFARSNLKLTIGADDPGIFKTSLEKEYSLANQLITDEQIKKIQENSINFCSELLVGRK